MTMSCLMSRHCGRPPKKYGGARDLWMTVEDAAEPVDNQKVIDSHPDHLRHADKTASSPRSGLIYHFRSARRTGEGYSIGAMSTLTFIFEDFASVKITPLTGVTSA